MSILKGRVVRLKPASLVADFRFAASRASGAIGCAFAGVLIVSLFIAAAPSVAAASETFCGSGQAAGQCNTPAGIAIDQSGGPGGLDGTVYVVDQNNSRVDVFDSTGHFLMAFGFGVVNGAKETQTCTSVCSRGSFEDLPTGIAVDQSTHDVYVAESGEGRIEKLAFDALTDKFEPLLSFGTRGSGPGQLDGRMPLAVDSSGDVWVGDVNRIQRFSGTGGYLSEVSLPGAGEFTGIAADSVGDIYTLAPPSREADELDVLTDPTQTTYTLTFGGYTTGRLSGTPDPKEVQKALEGLPSIGRGNVRVKYRYPFNDPSCSGPSSNSPDSPEKCYIYFVGKLADTNVEPLTVSGGAIVTTQVEGEAGTPGVLSKLKPDGELIERIDSGGHPVSLGVDPANGDVYVTDQRGPNQSPGSATLLRYSASGEELAAFGKGEVAGQPCGNSLAFSDSASRVFVVSCEGPEGESVGQSVCLPAPGPLIEGGSSVAGSVRKTTATLSAEVDPEGKATTYSFQYITEEQFVKNEEEGHEGFTGAQQTPVSTSIGADFSFHEVTAALAGLSTAKAYRFRVVAYNSNAAGGVAGEAATFATLPPASVEASVTEVTASSATLSAQIDPLGDATTYRFQYISREAIQRNDEAGEPEFAGAAQAPAEAVAIGSGEEPVSVSAHVQALESHTEYRFRVVVVNAAAPEGFGSSPLVFTTQAQAAALTLADGRGWELVSPPNKRGALIGTIEATSVIQAAVSGDAITYYATAPTETGPQGNGLSTQVLSARGRAGWESRDLDAPSTQAVGVVPGAGYEYRFFSSDLSLGVFQSVGPFEPALSSEASELTPYLRSDFATGGGERAVCSQSCYRPMLTTQDVTSGNRFAAKCTAEDVLCGPSFVGGTPDLSHVVLESEVGLTSTPGDRGGLYEYSEGQLALVTVLPDGEPLPPNQASLGAPNVHRGAVSEDGARVVWSAQGHLYLRDLARNETIELDAPQGGVGGTPDALFQLASGAGSAVYFTDTQDLTENAGAASSSPDLYECRIVEEAQHLKCSLKDLTPLIDGESAALEGGAIPGAATDGSYVYYVAKGDLTGSQVNERGERAHVGQPNLFMYHEGVTTFIATLSAEDAPDWANGDAQLGSLVSRVSPNGRWLAFMSDRSLTGYDNRDAVSGKPDEEIFLYHAGGGEGSVVCVSCNPTGARPHGVEFQPQGASEVSIPLAGKVDWPHTTWLAATMPGWTTVSLADALYQSRYLSDAGRLFFDAEEALTPQDSNGVGDVYEYEPPRGEGAPPNDDCAQSNVTFVPEADGCVSLISSGTSREESAFIDASENGNDVFFVTHARLSPLDYDSALDVYDAHVCTSESPCPSPPPPPQPACEGDACQSPTVSPEALTPASLSFAGAGNVLAVSPGVLTPKKVKRARKTTTAPRACAKKPAKRRAACRAKTRRGKKTGMHGSSLSRRAKHASKGGK